MTIQMIRQAPVFLHDTLRCLCINKDPVIIVTYGNTMAGASQLSPYLAGRKAYFLAGAWWSYSDPGYLESTRKAYLAMKMVFPEHQYFLLTNDLAENKILEAARLPHYFCHHNAFLDERIFKPLPGVKKTLDAIYTARLIRVKRHHLARNIDKWGLIYGYDPTDQKSQMRYLRHLRRAMPGMALLNGDADRDEYRLLNPAEVCRAYNSAQVGLCLSEIEGGNYSTTEYMLCGLPVVSTSSKGGRELFLDPSVSRIVDDDPEAIAQAVQELIKERIPPHLVRLRALEIMRKIRQDFIAMVNMILEEEGKEPDFAERFEKLFIHKMVTYPKTPEDFIRENGLG